MNIFMLVTFSIAYLSGYFLQIAWVNYRKEGIKLARYWYNTIPYTVIQPFCCSAFLFCMCILSLIALC